MHVASLCNQAKPDQQLSRLGLDMLFLCTCVQYCCIKCSCSMDVAHNFSECMLHEHNTGDGSCMPCSGTLLLCAMLKLQHNVTSFDLLPPGIELNKATLHADVSYCMHINKVKNCSKQQCVVKGMWLGDCADPTAI